MKTSNSLEPDLDWSQVSQTVRMLTLAIAQIDLSLSSGDESVSSLADSFTMMAENVSQISESATKLHNSEEGQLITAKCNEVSAQMHHAIISFQFYDKLTQRLSHLSNTLEQVADLVQEPSRLYNPSAWNDLQQEIKSAYTVEADSVMFDAVLNGLSAKQAISARVEHQTRNAAQSDDDVELF